MARQPTPGRPEALSTQPQDRTRALLDERARRLAKRSAAPETTEEGQLEMLLCRVGDSLYGLPMDAVGRTVPFDGHGKAPGGHPALLGFMAERGRIHEILDAGVLLEPGSSPPGGVEGCLVILRPPLNAALRVDAALGVAAAIPCDAEEPARVRILAGPADAQDKIAVLIAPDQLLAALENVSPPGGPTS